MEGEEGNNNFLEQHYHVTMCTASSSTVGIFFIAQKKNEVYSRNMPETFKIFSPLKLFEKHSKMAGLDSLEKIRNPC